MAWEHMRDLRWGGPVVQRCLDLMQPFCPCFWSSESKEPPGLESGSFMRSLVHAGCCQLLWLWPGQVEGDLILDKRTEVEDRA